MDASLNGIGDLLIGSLLGAVGLLAIILSLFRQKGADPLLASFGAFSLLYGIRLVSAAELAPTLGISRLTAAWITSLITYLIQIPAWFFFWKLLGDGWHKTVLWFLRIMVAFALVGVASDLIQGTPGTLSRHPNNVLVLIGMVVAILGLLRYRGRMTRDLRILFAGLVTFSLFVINDNLVSIGALPWDWREESIGFTLFVACLGVIAGRRFLATEHDLATLQSELATAQRIQATILPLRPPDASGLDIAIRFRPTSTVAGDFYDFLQPAPHQLGLVVADASGHGVPAALIASMFKVAFKSQRDRASLPSQLLSEVNGALHGSFRHGFVTAAYAYVDAGTGDLVVASAGHPLPLLSSARHSTVGAVGGQGSILGRFVDAAYPEQRLVFEPGDRLVIYTDGFTEARDGSGEPYGEDRLREFLSSNGEMSADEFCDSLLEEIDAWSRERPDDLEEDDLTLVVVDHRGRTPPE